ncbi:MAG: hypothetical protein F4X69_15870 [Gemmatimonadetes bacterium]|nr:hypothetical protein [Gemmatimonadota bacterium]
MLDELVKCIETLQRRMIIHAESLRANEWRTRTQLIDPLLCVLGWEVTDPAIVTPEYNVGGGRQRADYALLQPPDVDDRPLAVLESKALADQLTDEHRMQMLNYANATGIEFAGLTNGDCWELYKVFERGSLDERRILNVSIANTLVHQLAVKLLLLWRPIISGNYLAESSASLEQIVQTGNTPPPPPIVDWVPLTDYDPPLGTPPPKTIRFWDGTEQTISYWNRVLVLTAEKLYREGTLQVAHTPINLWEGEWNSIHTEPTTPDGGEFRARQIGNPPLYVHVNLDARGCRVGAIRLLQRYGIDPSAVYLLPRE